MTLDRSRTDDRAVMMIREPRSSSVPADTLDAIALLQASGAGSATHWQQEVMGNLAQLVGKAGKLREIERN